MAINQKIAQHDNESQGSTHVGSDSSSSSSDEDSLSCSEYEGEHEEMEMIMKRIRRRRRRRIRASPVPALRASPTCGKNSVRAQRSHAIAIANTNANANTDSVRMMKRLHFHLASLRSLLPPTARSSRSCSVIADAVRYRKALEKEIQLLLAALPHSHQVDVRRVECGGLQIGITCKKKAGLMVALMEAMENFGLHFANVSVSCQDDNITIDALSTQDGGEKAGALKGMLVATITRFSQ